MIETGLLIIDQEMTGLIDEPINGEIEKIVIDYGDGTHNETLLEIKTQEGEKLISRKGNDDGIFYPRNNAVVSGKNQNNIVLEYPVIEKFITIGKLILAIDNKRAKGQINNIAVFFREA